LPTFIPIRSNARANQANAKNSLLVANQDGGI